MSYRIGQRIQVRRWVRGARQGHPVLVHEVWFVTRLGEGTVTASPPGLRECARQFDVQTGVGIGPGLRISIAAPHEDTKGGTHA